MIRARYIYYQKIHRLHTGYFNGSGLLEKERLEKELRDIARYFTDNDQFFTYYRNGYTHHDELFFVIKTDAAFERTRENNAEFARAGKAAKLLRRIFRDVTIHAKDRITQARLVKVASRIVMADPINERGKRTVNNGDIQQFENFHFNERAGISDSLFVRCPVSFNRVSGEVIINIPSFVPRQSVEQAPGTTHFRILAAAAAINFDTEKYEYAMQTTPEIPLNLDPTQATTLTLALPANSKDIVLAALGIEYYQMVNSRGYSLKSGEYNATTIVLVDKAG